MNLEFIKVIVENVNFCHLEFYVKSILEKFRVSIYTAILVILRGFKIMNFAKFQPSRA